MSTKAEQKAKSTPQKAVKKKRCFVIGPIGRKDSEERRVADWLLNAIIRPVLEKEPFHYEVKRADEISDPGLISDQVIDAVMEWELVVADMTGPNANAFYELAIRHMEEKPVIHIIAAGQDVPFDVKDYRKVDYAIDRFEDVEAAKKELESQVRAIESRDYKPTNPIIKARGHLKLNRSADSKDKIIADLVSTTNSLKRQLDRHEVEILRLTPTGPTGGPFVVSSSAPYVPSSASYIPGSSSHFVLGDVTSPNLPSRLRGMSAVQYEKWLERQGLKIVDVAADEEPDTQDGSSSNDES